MCFIWNTKKGLSLKKVKWWETCVHLPESSLNAVTLDITQDVVNTVQKKFRLGPSKVPNILHCCHFFKIDTLKKSFPLVFWNQPSKIRAESFSKWVILSIFTVIFCSEETKDKRDGKEMALLLFRQNYSVFPGFIWQNPSSHFRWDESPILRGLL